MTRRVYLVILSLTRKLIRAHSRRMAVRVVRRPVVIGLGVMGMVGLTAAIWPAVAGLVTDVLVVCWPRWRQAALESACDASVPSMRGDARGTPATTARWSTAGGGGEAFAGSSGVGAVWGSQHERRRDRAWPSSSPV